MTCSMFATAWKPSGSFLSAAVRVMSTISAPAKAIACEMSSRSTRDLASVEVRERLDPSRIRPIDEMVKVGDSDQDSSLGLVSQAADTADPQGHPGILARAGAPDLAEELRQKLASS